MYLHKENRELFRNAILLTSQKLNVSEDIVEKDYYVTMILNLWEKSVIIESEWERALHRQLHWMLMFWN